jgi:hypothetical protein
MDPAGGRRRRPGRRVWDRDRREIDVRLFDDAIERMRDVVSALDSG